MTVPLPPDGDTSWSDWAGFVHGVATNLFGSTAAGRTLLTAADAAAQRTALSVPAVSGGITTITQLTQAAYDALGTKSATTLYVIVG